MAFFDFPTLCPSLFNQREKSNVSVIDSDSLVDQQREYDLWAKELKHSPFQAPLGLRRQDYDMAAAVDRSMELEQSEAESDVEDSAGSLEGDESEQMDDDVSDQDFSGLINLKMGAPDEATLKKCVAIFSQAVEHRAAEADAHFLFQYGPEAGDGRFRVTLAKFLSDEYKSPVKPENLLVTSGATMGLLLLAHLFFRPGDLVFCEDPTYFMAISILKRDTGLDLVSVPTDDHGIVLEELEKQLQAHHSHKPHPLTPRRPFWAMLYLIPAFQNPTGASLGTDRFKKIISLARQYSILVVCDDVYSLLYFKGLGAGPQNRMFAFDDPNDIGYQGNVVSNGSFSKIFGPGVRLGWLEVPTHIRDTFTSSGVSFSGGGLNHTMSGIMTSVISLGLLGELLGETRRSNEDKCQAACGILRNKYPGLLSFNDPAGGYFIWVQLPQGLKATEVLKLCEEAEGLKVSFFCGNVLSPSGGFRDHIRISYAFYEMSVITSAIHKLADIIHQAHTAHSCPT